MTARTATRQAPWPVDERTFRRQLLDLARMLRWRAYFTWTSVHSPPGFPDIVLVRGPRLVIAELKSEDGKLTEPQRVWLLDLVGTCAEVYLWRPSYLQRIAEVLA